MFSRNITANIGSGVIKTPMQFMEFLYITQCCECVQNDRACVFQRNSE
jgi:hypothetical protein